LHQQQHLQRSVNAPKPKRRYELASRVTTQTMTPPMTRFNVLKTQERRRRPHPATTRESDPNSVAKNTVLIRPTTLVRARSSSTVVERTIGRRRMLPNLSTRTTSRSTRRSMPNSTFSKRKPRRGRPSGPRPTRTLSPKKLTTSRSKKANQAIAKRIKRQQPKPKLIPTTAIRAATAAPIVARPPTPTPNRKAAAGKLIC
jgi:hypothetical protein